MLLYTRKFTENRYLPKLSCAQQIPPAFPWFLTGFSVDADVLRWACWDLGAAGLDGTAAECKERYSNVFQRIGGLRIV